MHDAPGLVSLESVEEAVIRIVADHLGRPSATLQPEMDIISDLGADSFDHIELVMTVEERFGITLREYSVDKMKTISSLVEIVYSSLLARRNGNAQILD